MLRSHTEPFSSDKMRVIDSIIDGSVVNYDAAITNVGIFDVSMKEAEWSTN